MSLEELFHELDFDGDAFLSREDLYRAACFLGWHWHEAPLYAFLDFLTVGSSLSRDEFVSCMTRLETDPAGIYGQLLQQGAARGKPWQAYGKRRAEGCLPARNSARRSQIASVERLLRDISGDRVAEGYVAALEELAIYPYQLRAESSALLIIDPQRSFTSGEWMRSLGKGGVHEVLPICRAFESCASLLEEVNGCVEVMFTRCPFPPESYGWDERLEGIIDPGQPYFIKPGNDVLQPPTNGCREWLESLLSRGITNLVVGGCTLNSCVRVSALETRSFFQAMGLNVVVDLGISGARTGNYEASPQFNGRSPVESALREMLVGGIRLAERVEWI